MVVFISNRENL